ncbi:MAG: hydroxymethylglutaryl-CoA reductase, degradative [Chloroflexi bacterium]|nr:MAG: hydroxymethylglutaryl-CoA reductase, degradative [Chloroflexota bacterium]
METKKSSRISQFYKKTLEERLAIIQDWLPSGIDLPIDGGLTQEQANNMIENVIGRYNLPFAVATNFLINGRDYLIPMVIEEPSVVAACSNAAKMFREGGGFTTSSDEPVMIGQIQVLDVPDMAAALQAIEVNKARLLTEADSVGGSIVKRGGGARDIQTRVFENTPIGTMLVIHLLIDTRDAMGANAINTAVEHLAPHIEALTGGRVNLRILSNLTDQRKARAEGMIPASSLARGDFSGADVVRAIVEAGVFAEVDPYRAATHNKGVMNGIDAVVIATGNDWRAVEAGAHAYAARHGGYSSMTRWWQDDDDNLRGAIEIPLSVGIVGGATRVHPMAQLALQILGVQSAQELAEVIAAVGLAQNLAAIRALATEGIQHGHMRMHARQLALAAGASVELVPHIVQQMIDENNIRLERAKELLKERMNK